ncbi:MAG: glycosyltransferase [Bacteroidetes bacterium]|nr:glycosyltransferase [Bacteroidota bacterium]
MTKVLRIINRFNLGGPTYNVAYLSKYISSEYETLLVGGAKDESEESSDFIVENLGLKPVIIKEMKREINLKNDYAAYKKIKKIIQEFKPDIVHTHASKAGTLGRLAAISCGVPIIIHTFHGHVFHSYFGKLQTAFYKNIERYLARKSTAIIAISEMQKQELTDVYHICKANKVRVISLGFDLSKFQMNSEEKRISFRTRYNIADEEIAICIIGRLVPVKNHVLFLEGLKIISEKTSQKIRAFIIGDGEAREAIEQKAKELSISFIDGTKENKNVLLTFTSWIKEIDVALAGSDIVALTSFNEGTPVSLIEAQAANKPIVSTRVGGIENVVSVETALLCSNNNVIEFSDQLLKLLENAELRATMGKKGWIHVKEKFHYTRLIKDMENFYKQLLKK